MTTHERLEEYKAAGICPNCGHKTDDKHTFCHECRKKKRDKYKSTVYPDGVKRCLDCGLELIISDRRTPERCPECILKRKFSYDMKRYDANKEKVKIPNHKSRIERLYGVTYEELVSIYREQGGTCAICNKELPDPTIGGKMPFIDHSHSTGKVRGLLCLNCNFAIGLFKDDVGILQSAIKYLS